MIKYFKRFGPGGSDDLTRLTRNEETGEIYGRDLNKLDSKFNNLVKYYTDYLKKNN
jgi:hypothetical protein